MRKRIKARVYRALVHFNTQANVSSLWLSIMALLLGTGFLLADTSNFSYFPLIQILNHNVWAIILFSYATVKFLQAVQQVPCWVTILASIVGAWVWNYMLVSFIFLGPKSINPLELLLFFPVICEVVDLALDIVRWRSPRQKESTHYDS